jgi:hypothetical protein
MHVKISIFCHAVKLHIKHLTITTSTQNLFEDTINPSRNWPNIKSSADVGVGSQAIKGNETADQLAIFESECPFTEPEPACGISAGIAKKAVRDWLDKGHKNSGSS